MTGMWVQASDAGRVLHLPWIIRCLFPLWLICPLPLHPSPGPNFLGLLGKKMGLGTSVEWDVLERLQGKGVREGAMRGSGHSVSGKKKSKTEFLGNTFLAEE